METSWAASDPRSAPRAPSAREGESSGRCAPPGAGSAGREGRGGAGPGGGGVAEAEPGVGRAGVAPPSGSGSGSASAAAAGGMANTAWEIIAFMVSISGWVLVSSTLPTDYWKVSTIDGTVITTATYWANLWKTCVTDSTGVSNCKDFPSMLALDGLHPLGPSPGPHSFPANGLGYPLGLTTPAGTPDQTLSSPGPTFPQGNGESLPFRWLAVPRRLSRGGSGLNPGPRGWGNTQTGLDGVGDFQPSGVEGSSFALLRVEDTAVGPLAVLGTARTPSYAEGACLLHSALPRRAGFSLNCHH